MPRNVAVEVDGRSLTYEELVALARTIAATLERHIPAGAPPFTAVFGQRSVETYAGIIGALLLGHAYVPLNPSYPAARTRTMLERPRCAAVIAGARDADRLDEVLHEVERPLLVVVPDAVNVDELARRWRPHTVVGADAVPGRELAPKPVDPGSPAYVLFTSGSTGHPKGVLVAHQNVAALVDASVERFEIAETDRFSQMFDTTFDLSVFDMFVAWERGACVVCPPPKALLSPARFVRENELTVWFSVPSVALFAKRLGALAPGSFPSLRWSLFCGEPLPAELAATWAAAGPQATLENLYGPTEATVFCSAYRWDPSTSPAECVNGIVPIGAPVPGTTMVVVDEELREVDAGCDGELVVGGRQVALGYLDEEERTAAAFVRLPARRGVYYRTGDRVRRPERDGPIAFLGRRDEQVKVNGHRVELAEVEAALREAAQTEAAVALAWPRTEVGASGITAFVSDTQVTPVSMRRALAERLPPYMVPREITVLHRFPLTANGKLDRSALLQRLEAGT